MLNWSEFSCHKVSAYPGFLSIKRLGILLLLLDGMLVHRRLLPAFRQVSLTVHQYPFIVLGWERHCESKVSCPRTHHKKPRPGLEPGVGPFDPESSALTRRSPRLLQAREKEKVWVVEEDSNPYSWKNLSKNLTTIEVHKNTAYLIKFGTWWSKVFSVKKEKIPRMLKEKALAR